MTWLTGILNVSKGTMSFIERSESAFVGSGSSQIGNGSVKLYNVYTELLRSTNNSPASSLYSTKVRNQMAKCSASDIQETALHNAVEEIAIL